jgi:hypothetical protein
VPNPEDPRLQPGRVLVKLRASTALRAAESRANLRPLFDPPTDAFAIDGQPRWFVADLPEGADTPWDLAHDRVADQLGISESDIVFAEPDIVHRMFLEPVEIDPMRPTVVGADCGPVGQDGSNRKAVGPDDFAWHLGDEYTQLGRARDAVEFAAPRTRIAHLDTGYYQAHVTVPKHVLPELERNFVRRENPESAEDPDNRRLLLDNSGHGTGTLSILAGGAVPEFGPTRLGGAPDAEVVPLRIADTVVLLRTSDFAQALNYATDVRCDVVTMSMGGLPSRVWRESVDRAYLAGVCIVSAAGNNFNGLPTRNIVYPARYGRVIAVCGVMADHEPYHRLSGLRTFEGNYGPASTMESALSAYTPNIPWAKFGCRDIVRLNGEGTSSATPQIAAAAALWFEKHKAELQRDWRRVEAVRNALFTSARKTHPRELGQGILQAADALKVRPVLGLPQTRSDSDSFAFLRVITGLGIVEPPPRERMFNLELAQRWLVSPELQELVPDPDAAQSLDPETLRRVMEAVIEDPGSSIALRKQVASRYPVATGGSAPRTERSKRVVPDAIPVCERQPDVPEPAHRRLRVYAKDPSLSTRLATAAVNEVTLKVRWERLEPGPIGEYLAIDDVDATERRYPGVDLNDPRLLAQDGWAPSEGNPQFHQQMVYAVAMKTIENFERALGRPVLWRPTVKPEDPTDETGFVRNLIIRPHALRQANAFYSPHRVALEFGYFEVSPDAVGDLVPNSRVYACLSHDIIAHETTHAILDGMYRRFNEPSNPDVLALHEGFADIVALMQHFTMPELLESEIARTRGNIEAQNLLGSLAVQFGQATGRGGALREAIGQLEDGVWKRLAPDPAEMRRRLSPHSRGAILVAAVFDAFIAIYRNRSADLLRIHTGGSGVLPDGAIHPDLVGRLAEEAAKSAGHVLSMCIRALDYLPPVDVTFFEFLRAIITADHDLVRVDRYDYRVAFVEAFRRWGIYPINLANPSSDTPRTLSVDTLRWQGLDLSRFSEDVRERIEAQYEEVVKGLKLYADACYYLSDREELFHATRERRGELREQLAVLFELVPDFARELGIDPELDFEVHELRRAIRVSPDGRHVPQIVVALTQEVERPAGDGVPAHLFRGGSTLVVDLLKPEVKYRIVKNISSEQRRQRTAEFVRDSAADPLRALFFAADRAEPFAALHALTEAGA